MILKRCQRYSRYSCAKQSWDNFYIKLHLLSHFISVSTWSVHTKQNNTDGSSQNFKQKLAVWLKMISSFVGVLGDHHVKSYKWCSAKRRKVKKKDNHSLIIIMNRTVCLYNSEYIEASCKIFRFYFSFSEMLSYHSRLLFNHSIINNCC